MVKLSVLLFGALRESCGTSKVDVELEEDPVEKGCVYSSSLLKSLTDTYPELDFEKSQISVAVNKKYILSDVLLKEGDEIALLPPIAGG